MTRTIKFGEPSKEAQEIYNIVLEAETSAIQESTWNTIKIY